MTLDPALTFLAIVTAGLLWATVTANLLRYRKRRMMTPEQRKAADEEMRIFGQEW